MLQQTTVATVLNYYERFLDRFGTVVDLANAPEQDLLLLWQGLGYYRRARHMHRAAQIIRDQYAGQFPRQLHQIEKLPGLGRYTARAIASFAFHQRLPIVEANTRRLWCRFHALTGDPTKRPVEEKIWQLAQNLLPPQKSWDFNQAAMDLGSMVCTPKKPSCGICPLARYCLAHQRGQEECFPQLPAKRAKVDVRHASLLLWNRAGKILVRQRPPTGTWAGLWEFPHIELLSNESPQAGLLRIFGPRFNQPLQWTGRSHIVRHAIMHYRVELTAVEARAPRKTLPLEGINRWVTLDELSSLPFSTPQRKLSLWLRETSHFDS
jgi:A/G-specific adenine glycosylase